ncbi:hypothetical protein [Aequorivita marina]|uniref:hypothetical protein n=1 Tax=Aequorivita marina TaxID=3073654 RepID=UPI00287547B7|nr:hypothetical protein [Aequorivita sp. S2608]MDS1297179.1 hypothetical protein [Aequorivita sp. S2608]
MILKFNLKNHFEAALSILLLSLGYFILIALFKFDIGIIMIVSIAFSLFVLPGIYLHIEYWLINKNEKYIIEQDSVTQIKNDIKEAYYLNDIKKVVVYGSATLFKPWPHLSAMEQYHFARVFLKNGEALTITCLLTPRVDKSLEILKGVAFKKKKGLFNSALLFNQKV